MSESHYRAAPPAEWPRSLRAAYALGRAVSAAMPIHMFLGIILGFAFMGATFGYAVAHDKYAHERPPEPPPACSVRSEWNIPLARYMFYLRRDDDDVIGRFADIDGAISAAGKLSCKVVP